MELVGNVAEKVVWDGVELRVENSVWWSKSGCSKTLQGELPHPNCSVSSKNSDFFGTG